MTYVTMTRPQAVSDELQFKLLRAAVFPFFLVAAAGGRVLRLGRPQAAKARSILAEARAASASALIFAFQG